MQPHSFSNLGGLEKPVDNRDVTLGAITSPVYTFKPVVTNASAWATPVEYQGPQPACGAHSGSKLCSLYKNSEFTPRFSWANIKSFDGFPIDSGTDMRSIFKSLKNTGALDFNLLGNDVTLSEQAYAHPTITTAMNANATKHKVPGYGFATDISFKGIKQYINDHGPVILLLRVGSEWWTSPTGITSWAEKDILPLRVPQTIVSGHFVVAHSYDESYIYFINSWSNAWGRTGHGYFGENYMQYINDAGTIVGLMFDKDLSFGMTDPEVADLQRLLNKDPRTRVATSGAGSPGNETTYFGALTKEAVIKFQTLYAIKPNVGYVGPLTRAVMNALTN